MQLYLQYMKSVIPTHNQTVEDQFSQLFRDLIGDEAEFIVDYFGEDSLEGELERQQLVCEISSELESMLNNHDDLELLKRYIQASFKSLGGKVVSDTVITLRNFGGVKIDLAIEGGHGQLDTCYIRATSTDLEASVNLTTSNYLIVYTVGDYITLAKI